MTAALFRGERAALACAMLSLPLAMCPAPVAAGEMYLSAGGGGGLSDAWSWQTLSWTPFSAFSETVVIVRGSVRTDAKTYVTDLPGQPDARVWANGIGLDGEAGWQIAGEWGQVAALGGIAWRDYALSPDDPNSSLGSNTINARATVQGHLVGGDRWGGFGYADYVSGIDEWYAEIKPYYTLDNGMRIGPELALSGGDDYLHLRTGVFALGWEFSLPWAGRFWAGGSAGALWDTDGFGVEPYGTLHITRKISGF